MRYIIRFRSAFLFGLILAILTGISVWVSHYIPDDYFDNVLSPFLMTVSASVALLGTWAVSRHTDGYRFRRAWAWTLVFLGLSDAVYIFFWMFAGRSIMNIGAASLTSLELYLGNLLGWMLLLYPTEALRPGWVNIRHALAQLVPMTVLVLLDYFVPVNLRPIIALYPIALGLLLIRHIREYRAWCEDNFSSLDDVDVEWIVRYLIMLLLIGVMYMYICLTHSHARGFTQQWLVIVMICYGTEQILFRRDPWAVVQRAEKEREDRPEAEAPLAGYRHALEAWMEKEKPYRNPDFKLIDLQNVLPMNRTYLSQFIHSEYDCSFYQFVNTYRIQEAKRLMSEKRGLKMAEVSAYCGFSSPSVFSRTFTAIEGRSPHDWDRQN